MKRFFLVMALATVLVSGSFAAGTGKKDKKRSVVSIGLKAAGIMTNNEGSYAGYGIRSKDAIGGGMFVSIRASKMFSVQPELLFLDKGNKAPVWLGNGLTTYRYIEVPVLLKAKFGAETDRVRPNWFVGPAIGFLTAAWTYPDKTDIKRYQHTPDVGMVFGTGLDVDNVSLDIRYEMGLSNLDTGADWYQESYHNTMVAFCVGYSYDLMTSRYDASKKLDSVIRGGIEGAVGMSNLSGTDITDNQARVGGGGGYFVQLPINKTFLVQPEFLYLARGCDFKGGTSVILTYAEMPILLKARFGGEKATIHPNLFVGPALSLLLTAKMYEGGGVPFSDLKDGLKHNNGSLVMGAGVEVKKFTVDVRYDLGLSDLENVGKTKTNDIFLTVGRLFN